MVSGPTSTSAEAPTLTGPVPVDGVWNPRLRAGVSWFATLPLGKHLDATAIYGIWRDQALCDTCDGGAGPGATGRELLGSSDLTVSMGRQIAVGEGSLRLAATAVLPASRDALLCNPLLGAPGVSALFSQPVGRSTLQTSARVARPFYVYRAAPVGRCEPPLRGQAQVQTLTGSVAPTPWNSQRTAGPNPSLSGALRVQWFDPLRVWSKAPESLATGLMVGLEGQRNRVDPEVRVDTLTGDEVVPRSTRPITASIPWSLSVGAHVSARATLQLRLANRLPTWLADPGGTLRALPARTAVSAEILHRF